MLVLGWAPFVESASGFGVAVAGIAAAERPAEEVAVTRQILAVAVGTVALLVLAGALLMALPGAAGPGPWEAGAIR